MVSTQPVSSDMFKHNSTVAPRPGAGFSLTELLATLAIAAILLGIAAPSFQDVIARYRMSEVSRGMADRLQVAMHNSEARGRTSICVSSNGSTCSSGPVWTDGYIVFTDGGAAGVIDGTDQVIERAEAARSGVTIISTDDTGSASFTDGLITFDERRPDVSRAVRFTVCNPAREPHLVVLNRIGSVRQSRGATPCA